MNNNNRSENKIRDVIINFISYPTKSKNTIFPINKRSVRVRQYGNMTLLRTATHLKKHIL